MSNPKQNYNFNADLALSKLYENKFANYLRKMGFNDVWLAPNYKYEDYDVITGRYETITYEIKLDRYMAKTGKFCLETFSNKEKNSFGWFFKTKADKIVVFYNLTDFIWIDTVDLRDAWFNHPNIWTKKEVEQTWGTTICWLADCKKISGLKVGSIE